MSQANRDQIALWDGRVGERWAAMQAPLDAWVARATVELQARAGAVAGLRVLDIGCGNGETCTLWLAGGAEVTGVDVSQAMLSVAAMRTQGKATLVHADAADWRGEHPFDLAVSQFGLMFFADPVAAFANIAANVRPGGRLLFTCWQGLAENEWVSKPMGAIRDLLPPAPASPGAAAPAPGPFALANRERLQGIVERAGFARISITPFEFPVCLASEGGVDAAVRFTMTIGPTAEALIGASKEARAEVAVRLRAALAPCEKDGAVALGGATWIVEAVRPG